MPVCRCRAHGCMLRVGGVYLDTETARRHADADKWDTLQQNVVEAQVEQIGSWLTSTHLADVPSPIPQPAGGRAWARSRPTPEEHDKATRNIFDNQSEPSTPPQYTFTDASRKKKIAFYLNHLCDIEQRLTELKKEGLMRLCDASFPVGDSYYPWPFGDLEQQCDVIHRDLTLISVKIKDTSVLEAKRDILNRLQSFAECVRQNREAWEQGKPAEPAGNVIKCDTGHHFEPVFDGADPVMQMVFFMVAAMNIVVNTTLHGCTFMMEMTKKIVFGVMTRENRSLRPSDKALLDDFPADIRPAIEELDLDGKCTIYAVCPDPQCHFTYKPEFKDDSPIASYPTYCQHRRYKGSRRCNARLTRPRMIQGKEVTVPIKTFVSFDFKDWLAELLSRSGLEENMDAAWATAQTADANSEMRDIFDGRVLREFKGPDSLHFSIGNGEGRYVFSLGCDFFNPHGNKQAGKKKSIGIISLVCLNLPPDLRYKPENIFLAGIIPGPKEPPVDALNHYLKPLIDDLCEFWKPGVWFSCTSKRPNGRLVRCALIAVVCDLPAARVNAIGKCMALGPRTQNWEYRTNDECREFAATYAYSSTKKMKKDIFQATGVRWSELLRLEYFDITRFVVVDAMHNLFLGLIKEHFEGILGIRLDPKESLNGRKESDSAVIINVSNLWKKSFSPKEQTNLRKAVGWLEDRISTDLKTKEGWDIFVKRFNKIQGPVLVFLCSELQCPEIPRLDPKDKTKRKRHWILELLEWRKSQTEFVQGKDTNGPVPHHGNLFTKAEILEIRSDISTMITPSWLTPIPKNLGEPGHGKLKADQWRVLGATYLPASLVRMWSTPIGDNGISLTRRRDVLRVTMLLLSAVNVASSRVSSEMNADRYLFLIISYIEGVRKLFPEYEFRPNQHMEIHLHEYLRSFGPVHSWWTFPFERVIGMLQRIPTNCKDGELEKTIALSFNRSARLRALVTKIGCPLAIRNCQSALEKLANPRVRNTFIPDMFAWSSQKEEEDNETSITIDLGEFRGATPVPRELFPSLNVFLGSVPPLKAKFFRDITINGVTFSTATRHKGNSCVLVKNGRGKPIPARIMYIIMVTDDCILMAVQLHKPAVLHHNPYAPYKGEMKWDLWSSSVEPLRVITMGSVQCHFTMLEMMWEDQKVVLVGSLAREHREGVDD